MAAPRRFSLAGFLAARLGVKIGVLLMPLLLAGMCWYAAAVLSLFSRAEHKVLIDNANDFDVVVSVDDGTEMLVYARGDKLIRPGGGAHRLVAKANGKVIEDASFTVGERRGVGGFLGVFNLGGAGRYVVIPRVDKATDEPDLAKLRVFDPPGGSHFFAMPDDVTDPLVDHWYSGKAVIPKEIFDGTVRLCHHDAAKKAIGCKRCVTSATNCTPQDGSGLREISLP